MDTPEFFEHEFADPAQDNELLRLERLTARRADELSRAPGPLRDDQALWQEAEDEILSRLQAQLFVRLDA